jgi:hypothetical protein
MTVKALPYNFGVSSVFSLNFYVLSNAQYSLFKSYLCIICVDVCGLIYICVVCVIDLETVDAARE